MVYETPPNMKETRLMPMLCGYAQEYRLFNVVIVHQSLDGTIQISMYCPYEKKIITSTSDTYEKETFFYDSTKNFHLEPLKVSIFPEEVRAIVGASGQIEKGADFEFAKVLAHKLNATLTLHSPLDGEEYGNPITTTNGTGSLGQVMRGEVDIQVNSRFLRLDLFRNATTIAEPTNSIGRDDMCILVPTPAYRSVFTNLIHALDISLWLSIVFIIIPFTLLVRYVAKMSAHNEGTKERKFSEFSYLDTICYYFKQSLTHLPQKSQLRLVILSWIVYTFYVVNILECCLTSAFTVKSLHSEIRSIDDLTESNLQIIAATDYDRLIRAYFHSSLGNVKKHQLLIDKLLPMNWSEYNRYLNANVTAFAYANKHHLTSYYANVKIMNGDAVFSSVPECVVPFLGCYILPSGSSLVVHVNDIIDRLQQAGIFQYWEEQISSKTHPHHFIRSTHVADSLGFQHIAFAFYFLFVGNLIASVSCLCEVYRSRRARLK